MKNEPNPNLCRAAKKLIQFPQSNTLTNGVIFSHLLAKALQSILRSGLKSRLMMAEFMFGVV